MWLRLVIASNDRRTISKDKKILNWNQTPLKSDMNLTHLRKEDSISMSGWRYMIKVEYDRWQSVFRHTVTNAYTKTVSPRRSHSYWECQRKGNTVQPKSWIDWVILTVIGDSICSHSNLLFSWKLNRDHHCTKYSISFSHLFICSKIRARSFIYT